MSIKLTVEDTSIDWHTSVFHCRRSGDKEDPSDVSRIEIVLHRNAAKKPSVSGFELVTNKKGSTRTFSGTAEYLDVGGNILYTIELAEAVLASWHLESGEGNTINEVWTIVAEGFTLSPKGGSEHNFQLRR